MSVHTQVATFEWEDAFSWEKAQRQNWDTTILQKKYSCRSDLLPLTFLVIRIQAAKLKTDKTNRSSCSSANVISMLMLIRVRSVHTNFIEAASQKSALHFSCLKNLLGYYSHKTIATGCELRRCNKNRLLLKYYMIYVLRRAACNNKTPL